MAKVRPFKAYRPAKDKVHMVVTRSIDAYSKEVMNTRMRTNPYSFLHVLKPDFNSEVKFQANSIEKHIEIKSRFIDFFKEEILIKDHQVGYYIYRQKSIHGTSTGIIGLASCEDYKNGVIKRHEETISHREELLKDYLKVCDIHAEPVCFTYQNQSSLDEIIEQICTQDLPVYDFSTVDKNRHSLWLIDEPAIISEINTIFSKVDHYYIADGHHRSAASTLFSEEERIKNNKHTGEENYNFFMGVFFSETQLKIFEFNRIIKGYNGLSLNEIILQLRETFTISLVDKEVYQPKSLHEISMYVNKTWYSLVVKKDSFDTTKFNTQLDTSILSNNILKPIFNIHNLKNDKRVEFIPGIKGPEELINIVDSDSEKIAFGLFPISMDQLKSVSDANEIMPPKSTWIEPKMRSGMTIFEVGS
jgi:uncharacterized protein (DUF1015 family)